MYGICIQVPETLYYELRDSTLKSPDTFVLTLDTSFVKRWWPEWYAVPGFNYENV